jgi:ATP-dependent Lon protease
MKTQSEQLPTGPFPLIPMRNMVLFPNQTMPIVVGRAKSRIALEEAKHTNQWIVLVAQSHDHQEGDPTTDDFYHVGTLARIDNIEGGQDRAYHATVTGVARFHISKFTEIGGHWQVEGDVHADREDLEQETMDSLVTNMKKLAKEIFTLLPIQTEQLQALVDSIDDPIPLTHLVSQYLDAKLSRKQELLEMTSLKDRFLVILEMMVKFREELKVQREVQQKVNRKIGKQQREAILREQIRALQDELGDRNSSANNEYREKIEKAGMPEDVAKVAMEQVDRLESMGNQSPETHVVRNYLDLLIDLPWSKSSGSSFDLKRAREILDEDHYGLEKIKRRVVQHLAVLKLKKDMSAEGRINIRQGSILLFVGPPGVGKTSLGKSIARAMGREFVRVSLGGVRDDAEIRGHRRTYVGALPGRIIDGIKRAKVNNPVFMLDEIDKLNRGWGGDPASALLETLDPEQNNKFLDHYLDVPFDLSNVIFIGTANSLETIPGPLLDRMEVITLTGYTTAEKMHISKTHLVPKQLSEHGVEVSQMEIAEETQHKLISGYTREAGVRELQRLIGATVRSGAEKIVAGDVPLPVKIGPEHLDEILGAEKYLPTLVAKDNPPGVVTGLAWTPLGGEILFIESSRMPGTGKLTITGQLGDVMKESAQIALSLVRSRMPTLYKSLEMDKEDVHVHVPAGAIPKDGPSAGVAMLLALASLVLQKPISSRLAMTGEITLRGAVLPVGGIKEKVIAAHRAGIQKVILPKQNERDLRDVPEEVKNGLQFEFVETADELFKKILDFEFETRSFPTPTFNLPNPGPAACS